MPSIRPWENPVRERLLASERRVLADINAILTHFGARPYRRLAEMFGPNPILATFEELDHYGPREGACYVGSIHGLGRTPQTSWPAGDGPRVVAYLRSHHKATTGVMMALAEAGIRAVCIVPEAGEAFKQRHASQAVAILDHPVTLGPLLEEADAMIGYASIGTVTEALLKGVPLLMIPATVEQYLLAKRVEAIGAGVVIEGASGQERIRDGLAALLARTEYRSKALAFSAKYAMTSVPRAADLAAQVIIERLERARGDGSVSGSQARPVRRENERAWG